MIFRIICMYFRFIHPIVIIMKCPTGRPLDSYHSCLFVALEFISDIFIGVYLQRLLTEKSVILLVPRYVLALAVQVKITLLGAMYFVILQEFVHIAILTFENLYFFMRILVQYIAVLCPLGLVGGDCHIFKNRPLSREQS